MIFFSRRSCFVSDNYIYLEMILNDYINTKRYFGKDYKTTVTELREALYDAATPAIIRKQLEKHLAEPLPSLQKSCLQVLAKHQI